MIDLVTAALLAVFADMFRNAPPGVMYLLPARVHIECGLIVLG